MIEAVPRNSRCCSIPRNIIWKIVFMIFSKFLLHIYGGRMFYLA